MRKFINPERELKENIRVTVEAENTKELKDLAKSILGDDYDAFNQDFPEPTAECDGPECEPFEYVPDAFAQHDAAGNEYLDCQNDPGLEDHDEFENYVDPFESNPFDEKEQEESVDFEARQDEDTDGEISEEDDADVELTPRAKALIDKTNKLAKENHNKSKVMVDNELRDADEFEESYDSTIVDPHKTFENFLNDGDLEECSNSGKTPRTSVRVEEDFDDSFIDEEPEETEFDFEDESNYYDTPEAQEAAEYWASLNDPTDDDYIEYPEEGVYDEDGVEITEDVDIPGKTKKDPKAVSISAFLKK